MPLPIWAIALVLAAAAPFAARMLMAMFVRRGKERSARILSKMTKADDESH